MKRKIIFLSVILLSLCLISQASAQDTDLNANESSIESQETDVLTTTINSNNYTSEGIQKTINEAADGDTIYFNGSFELDKQIEVSKPVKIVGCDGASITSQDFSHINSFFNIQSTNVVLSNLIFKGGSLKGAVNWQGSEGVISNCDFRLCINKDGSGGAIVLSADNCNITDCTFTRNQASYGGAIWITGTNNRISQCSFKENFGQNSISYGGAVYSTCANLIIEYCNFTENYAADCGGAIVVKGEGSRIFYSKFNNNRLSESNKTGGGAVFSDAEGLTIDGCQFTGNQAPQSNGGAVVLGKYNTVEYSYFKDNSALLGKDIYTNSTPTVTENNFFIKYGEVINDLVYGISESKVDNLNHITHVKVDSKISFISAGIIFTYGTASDPVRIDVTGGSVVASNIKVLSKDKSKTVSAKISFSKNILSISGLPVGEYVLQVTTTPDDDHLETTSYLSINVKKATAVITAEKKTVAYKKGYKWEIKLTNSKTGKPISNMKMTLKVYTGKKVKTVTVKTNSKGIASYQTRKLSKGTHKVKVSANDGRYNFNTVLSSIKVIKQKAVKFKVQRTTGNDGALLSIQVLNKKTKKPINGVKVKLLIYNGKKLVKTVTLKTKKLGKFKGICGYSTNKLTVGTHKVKIMPNTIKYGGTATSSMKITKTAKKHRPWETKDTA